MWLPRAAPRSCSGWLTALLLGLRREYLLLPRFSLISHFASCDSGLCVPCHQFAARSRQEARETRPKVRGTAACWKAAGGCQLCWCCRASVQREGRRSGVLLQLPGKGNSASPSPSHCSQWASPGMFSRVMMEKVHTGSVWFPQIPKSPQRGEDGVWGLSGHYLQAEPGSCCVAARGWTSHALGVSELCVLSGTASIVCK